jgi:hypothetical protein
VKKIAQLREGQRCRKSGDTYTPDAKGDYVFTKRFSGGKAEFVPLEGFLALSDYTEACESAKQEYLAKLTVIREEFDARTAKLNQPKVARP